MSAIYRMHSGWIVECLARRAGCEGGTAAFGVIGVGCGCTTVLEDDHDIVPAVAELREGIVGRVFHVSVDEPGFTAFDDTLSGAAPSGDEFTLGCCTWADAVEHCATNDRVIGNCGVPGKATAASEKCENQKVSQHEEIS